MTHIVGTRSFQDRVLQYPEGRLHDVVGMVTHGSETMCPFLLAQHQLSQVLKLLFQVFQVTTPEQVINNIKGIRDKITIKLPNGLQF